MPGLRVGKSVAVNTLMPASLDLRTHATYRCAPRAFAVGAVQRQVPFRRSPRVTFSSHVPPQAASLDALGAPPAAPARWRNVKEILHGALDRPVGERAAFLDAACGGDDALRREVDSLLAASEQPSGFLESSAPLGPAILYAAAREEAGDLMALLAEALGSHYTLARERGGGGM